MPPWPSESTMRYGPKVNLVRPSSSCLACHGFSRPISTSRSASCWSGGAASGSGSSPAAQRSPVRASSRSSPVNSPLVKAHCSKLGSAGRAQGGQLRIRTSRTHNLYVNRVSMKPQAAGFAAKVSDGRGRGAFSLSCGRPSPSTQRENAPRPHSVRARRGRGAFSRHILPRTQLLASEKAPRPQRLVRQKALPPPRLPRAFQPGAHGL